MKRLFLICLLLLLCGCGKDEEVPPKPKLTELYTSIELESVSVGSLGSQCGGVYVSDRIADIHPYYDLPEHVTVTCMLVSANDWWTGVLDDFDEDCVIQDFESYNIITTTEGVTYGYMPISETEAVIVDTRSLPSGYVKLVMDKLYVY